MKPSQGHYVSIGGCLCAIFLMTYLMTDTIDRHLLKHGGYNGIFIKLRLFRNTSQKVFETCSNFHVKIV
jgi:hypothetical protein